MARWKLALVAGGALLAGVAMSPAVAGGADEPLPTDPSLVTGKLDNGLSYVVRRHNNPAGRISLWLHVSTGSLNETEEQRGIAHYLEHMAFNGSKNFPPGTVVPLFQSLGLTFGMHQNAFTSFDQTTYQLALQDVKPETIEKGMQFLSDVAGGLSLLDNEIEEERGIILEEKRTRLSPQQRVQEAIREKIAPGSTFGRRLPIGTEETIRGVKRPDFQSYYSKWYVPENMTFIAVGDVDAPVIVEQVRRHFGAIKAGAAPANLDIGLTPYAAPMAIIATDPELTSAGVTIVRVEKARPPVRTVEAQRTELIETIGTWAFNRRAQADIAKGTRSYHAASAGASDMAGVIRMISVSATGKTENFRQMLADLGEDLARARLHGFSDREIEDARATMIAQAENAVRQEPTLPARALLNRINGAVNSGEPIMNAAQRLDLLRRLLPSITAAEVAEAFRANFDSANVAFVLQAPSNAPGLPSESEWLSLGQQALSVKPAKRADDERAASLLKEIPAGGKAVETKVHQGTGVTSVWFDNGVRMHHKHNDNRKDEVSIVVTLAGGQIEESAENRGITDAAALAWSRPATRHLSSTQVRDFMTGKKVRINGGSGADTLSLSISGGPADLEPGVQLAYALLTEPRVEEQILRQWTQMQSQVIAARRTNASAMAAEALVDSLYPPGEVRPRPLTTAQVQALTAPAAQAWLERLIKTAPIEIVVVGDMPADAAVALVGKYFGSLPKRERIGASTLDDKRAITPKPGPIDASLAIESQTPQGFVLNGFVGTDIDNIADARALQLAARVLSTRMTKVLREEKQLVYSMTAASRPGAEYPGFGLFTAQASTDPRRGDELAAALEEMYAAFAKDGPTAEELDIARRQIINQLDEQMKEPNFWTQRLAAIDYRGLKMDDIQGLPNAIESLTAAQVKEVFAKYFTPDRRIRVVATPVPKAG